MTNLLLVFAASVAGGMLGVLVGLHGAAFLRNLVHVVRMIGVYNFEGHRGLVWTGLSADGRVRVSIYHTRQAKLETQVVQRSATKTEYEWAMACEHHREVLGQPYLGTARKLVLEPTHWCEACRKVAAGRGRLHEARD